jgi:hypothetical protein
MRVGVLVVVVVAVLVGGCDGVGVTRGLRHHLSVCVFTQICKLA